MVKAVVFCVGRVVVGWVVVTMCDKSCSDYLDDNVGGKNWWQRCSWSREVPL